MASLLLLLPLRRLFLRHRLDGFAENFEDDERFSAPIHRRPI